MGVVRRPGRNYNDKLLHRSNRARSPYKAKRINISKQFQKRRVEKRRVPKNYNPPTTTSEDSKKPEERLKIDISRRKQRKKEVMKKPADLIDGKHKIEGKTKSDSSSGSEKKRSPPMVLLPSAISPSFDGLDIKIKKRPIRLTSPVDKYKKLPTHKIPAGSHKITTSSSKSDLQSAKLTNIVNAHIKADLKKRANSPDRLKHYVYKRHARMRPTDDNTDTPPTRHKKRPLQNRNDPNADTPPIKRRKKHKQVAKAEVSAQVKHKKHTKIKKHHEKDKSLISKYVKSTKQVKKELHHKKEKSGVSHKKTHKTKSTKSNKTSAHHATGKENRKKKHHHGTIKKDVAKKDVSKKDVTKKDVPKKDVSKKDVPKKDVSKKDVKKDVAKIVKKEAVKCVKKEAVKCVKKEVPKPAKKEVSKTAKKESSKSVKPIKTIKKDQLKKKIRVTPTTRTTTTISGKENVRKVRVNPIVDKPIGVVNCSKDKWVLTLDFSKLAVRQVKVYIADKKVEVRGLYRTHRKVWKNINENYTIPDHYPCVVHNTKNGVWTVVARDCKGKCAWHRPEWPFPNGFKWPWEGRPNWPFENN